MKKKLLLTLNPSISILLLLLLQCLIVSHVSVVLVEGGKGKVHIPDDLDDVFDDEEDEAWKEWGKKKSSSEFDPPPDFDTMDPSQIQHELLKRQMGPAFGFVKLGLGIPRTREKVAEIAIKWTKLLRTGALGVKFMGVDLGTVMFNVQDGHKVLELKEFLLSQEEAYEIKVGDQVFRRPGDPPLDELIQKLRGHHSNNKEEDHDDDEHEHVKEEL